LSLEAVSVTVRDWAIRARSAERLEVTITCDGGTYIRALARDLGRLTRSAAHLNALRRTRSGVFDVRDANSVDDLRGRVARVGEMRAAIPTMPTHTVLGTEVERVRRGQAVVARSDAARVALIDGCGDLVAIAERDGDFVRPCVVMQP
jgi:tRNA pseudouridine55 synthase